MKAVELELQSFKAAQTSSKEEMMKSLTNEDADLVRLMEQNKQKKD